MLLLFMFTCVKTIYMCISLIKCLFYFVITIHYDNKTPRSDNVPLNASHILIWHYDLLCIDSMCKVES